MANVSENLKLEHLWKELGNHFYLRFGDVFISYFISFEIIFNWKFFYTLIVSDETKSKKIIKEASELMSQASYFEWILDFFGNPSTFTLAIFSALVMTLLYPIFQFALQILRKIIFYHANKRLDEDYPSREDYERLKNTVDKSLSDVDSLKKQRLSDIFAVSDMLLRDNLIKRKDRIQYSVLIGSEKSSFKNDEIVRTTNARPYVIEKIDPFSSSVEDKYIVINLIGKDIYLVARLYEEIPVSKQMLDSGKDYFAVTKFGQPEYLTKSEWEDYISNRKSGLIYYSKISHVDELIRILKP